MKTETTLIGAHRCPTILTASLVMSLLLAAFALIPARAEEKGAGSTTPDAPVPTRPTLGGEKLEAFQQRLLDAATQASERRTMTVVGREGWLFLGAELRHLGIGRFWGEDAIRTGVAAREDRRDPLPVIVDYHEQLKEREIELILVPVPPKAAIYPEKFDDSVQSEAGAPRPRVDPHHQEFYQLLRQRGVNVLDLTEVFLAARDRNPEIELYCRQDTHWSGKGLTLAAQVIAQQVGERPLMEDVTTNDHTIEHRTIEIRGDLYDAAGLPDLEREQLQIGLINGGRQPISDRQSPIVLLGDSHLLVFHIGQDMHATGAGLGDHLAHQLGFPLDVLGVRGSGATASRRSLTLRRDNLEGKKMIIWVFTAREFTEAQSWQTIPATLPPM